MSETSEMWKRIQERHPHGNDKWRTVIVGLPIIRKLLNGEDVELESFRINLIPDDVLWNNREDVMVLFGDDVDTAQRVFKARELLSGKTDARTTLVERAAPAASKPEAAK